MYEDTKFKSNINWKSLLFKLGILLLIVFLICFIAFRPKKDNNLISLENNITDLKEAAIIYYKNNLTAKEIGDYQKVTLKELIEDEVINEIKDNDGNICNTKKSYAYLSKTRDDEFVLKVNMVCGYNKDSKVFNLTGKDLTIVATKEEDPKVEEGILVEEEVIEEPNIKEDIQEEDKEIADSSNKKEENNKTNDNVYNNKISGELKELNNNKVLRYKHIKYGEWFEGTKTGYNIENSTREIYNYTYCLNDYCVVDRIDNLEKYEGYTATFYNKETIPVYRYIYVVWSNSTCIKGFVNTGITELR